GRAASGSSCAAADAADAQPGAASRRRTTRRVLTSAARRTNFDTGQFQDGSVATPESPRNGGSARGVESVLGEAAATRGSFTGARKYRAPFLFRARRVRVFPLSCALVTMLPGHPTHLDLRFRHAAGRLGAPVPRYGARAGLMAATRRRRTSETNQRHIIWIVDPH